MNKVEFEKRNILSLYRADIHKFAGALREKGASIFSEIPAQLSKHEKKFSVSALRADARINLQQAACLPPLEYET